MAAQLGGQDAPRASRASSRGSGGISDGAEVGGSAVLSSGVFVFLSAEGDVDEDHPAAAARAARIGNSFFLRQGGNCRGGSARIDVVIAFRIPNEKPDIIYWQLRLRT